MHDFDQAMREWDAAVKAKAAELVRQGVPPYDAIDKARLKVSEEWERRARNIKLLV